MTKPRIIGTLIGDVVHEPKAQTKYGYFFNELRAHFPTLVIHDANLRGTDRWLNALVTFNVNRRRWRNRFYKNVSAFRQRSKRTSAAIQAMKDQADFVLQVGVMFQVHTTIPTIIYTDYTAHLSAKKPESGRSPFTLHEREQWIGMERDALHNAAHVFTRGEFVRQSIVSDYGVLAERVTAIGGGVNLATLPSISKLTNNDTPTALFIGKSLYRKGGDLLLKAFAIAREQVPQAKLLMLTDDPIPADLPLAGVELVDPAWNREAIDQLYRRADCFVLPSRLETWGDVLLEAMAYELPCIGVDDDAMSEIIDHEQNGLMIPPEDVSALARALVRLFTESGLRREWGRAARQKVESQYTWLQVVGQMVPVIEELHKQKTETL